MNSTHGSQAVTTVAVAQEPLLSIEQLCVEYVTENGSIRAVDDVSIRIGHGEVFGLAGESGSGKSTAAMAALRLLPPPAIIRSGRVVFSGQDVLSMSERQLRDFRWRKVAVVFQSAMNALNPVLTVGEQIRDVIVAHEKTSPTDALERAHEMLRLVGIESSRIKSYPHQLSGGMRQRVVIAIALALRPPMLFMDEPTTALDVVVQKEILQQIAELKERLGFSILFISHDLSLMLEFCDTVGIVYAGRLCEVAPAKTLFHQPRHPYTRGLMNSFPEMKGPRHRMIGISGAPPNMLHPPAGCRFHPRCPEVIDACREELPPLLPLAPRHLAACLRATAAAQQPPIPSQVQRSPEPSSAPESLSSAASNQAADDQAADDQAADDSAADNNRVTEPEIFPSRAETSPQALESTAAPPHIAERDPRNEETQKPPATSMQEGENHERGARSMTQSGDGSKERKKDR